MPVVSALITTYNRAGYVGKAIESVRAQTFTDWELIVINDGSTDQTLEVLEALARGDARIRVITQPHRGNYSAVNRGLRAARGEFIAFLDDDDRWLPSKLEEQVRCLRADPSIGWVFVLARLIDAEGRPMSKVIGQDFEPSLRQLIEEEEIWLPSQTMMRRACVERIGLFDDRVRSGADRHLWIRLLQIYPVRKLPVVLAEYRIHSGNTSSDRLLVLTNRILLFAELQANPAQGLPRAMLKRRLSQLHYLVARLYLARQDYRQAARYYASAVGLWPTIGLSLEHWRSNAWWYALTAPYLGAVYTWLRSLIRPPKRVQAEVR